MPGSRGRCSLWPERLRGAVLPVVSGALRPLRCQWDEGRPVSPSSGKPHGRMQTATASLQRGRDVAARESAIRRRDQGVAPHADCRSVFYFPAPQAPHCASRRRLARPRTVVHASRRTRLKGRFQHERNREYNHSGKCKTRNRIPPPSCHQRRVAYQACCERLIGPDGVQVSVFALDRPPRASPCERGAL